MARKYKRKLGSRNYRTGYCKEALANAVHEVKERRLSIQKASRKYQIPYGTLYNKFTDLHQKQPGGQVRLPQELESKLVRVIEVLTDWKVSLGAFDI